MAALRPGAADPFLPGAGAAGREEDWPSGAHPGRCGEVVLAGRGRLCGRAGREELGVTVGWGLLLICVFVGGLGKASVGYGQLGGASSPSSFILHL